MLARADAGGVGRLLGLLGLAAGDDRGLARGGQPRLHLFLFSSRRRHPSLVSDWSSDVCSSDLARVGVPGLPWVASLPDLGLLDDVASDVFWYFNRNGLQTETAEHARWERRYPSGRFTPEPKGPDLRSRLRGSLLAG